MGKCYTGRCFIVVLFLFSIAGSVNAESISFLNSGGAVLQGVDGNTSGWSSDNTTKKLNTSEWSLLGGQAALYSSGGKLTHTGTTGIGIFGGEKDEINLFEKAVITFDNPYFLDAFQVCSIFSDDFFDFDETGMAKLYLGGSLLNTKYFSGDEDGIVSVIFDSPYAVDRVEFMVANKFPEKVLSEFSLAGLNVSMMPEPVSSSLFLFGGMSMAFAAARKRKILA